MAQGRRARAVMLMVALGVAVACTPLVRNHGYIPLEEDLAQIVVGQDTRETVQERVGPPTSGGVLRESGFFYVASTFRTLGALAPQEVTREVVVISFSDTGVVSNIERFGLEDGRVVALSRRVTETGVQDSTFIRQLLSSIGRIDPGQFLGDGS